MQSSDLRVVFVRRSISALVPVAIFQTTNTDCCIALFETKKKDIVIALAGIMREDTFSFEAGTFLRQMTAIGNWHWQLPDGKVSKYISRVLWNLMRLRWSKCAKGRNAASSVWVPPWQFYCKSIATASTDTKLIGRVCPMWSFWRLCTHMVGECVYLCKRICFV